ncbi:SAGA-associated factor 11-like isoform X2 [Wolffia australiana]
MMGRTTPLPEDDYELSSYLLGDLVDCIIADVASECHRIARLGLDRNLDDEEEELRLSKQARTAEPANGGNGGGGSGGETTSKYVVDIFGQTHPAVANEIFECMNCGRSVIAGRFAPHLEKCMGKGRKARMKTTRSSTVAQSRHSRASPVTVYAPQSAGGGAARRVANGSGVAAEYSDSVYELD